VHFIFFINTCLYTILILLGWDKIPEYVWSTWLSIRIPSTNFWFPDDNLSLRWNILMKLGQNVYLDNTSLGIDRSVWMKKYVTRSIF
jgi:hypothetical protein